MPWVQEFHRCALDSAWWICSLVTAEEGWSSTACVISRLVHNTVRARVVTFSSSRSFDTVVSATSRFPLKATRHCNSVSFLHGHHRWVSSTSSWWHCAARASKLAWAGSSVIERHTWSILHYSLRIAYESQSAGWLGMALAAAFVCLERLPLHRMTKVFVLNFIHCLADLLRLRLLLFEFVVFLDVRLAFLAVLHHFRDFLSLWLEHLFLPRDFFYVITRWDFHLVFNVKWIFPSRPKWIFKLFFLPSSLRDRIVVHSLPLKLRLGQLRRWLNYWLWSLLVTFFSLVFIFLEDLYELLEIKRELVCVAFFDLLQMIESENVFIQNIVHLLCQQEPFLLLLQEQLHVNEQFLHLFLLLSLLLLLKLPLRFQPFLLRFRLILVSQYNWIIIILLNRLNRLLSGYLLRLAKFFLPTIFQILKLFLNTSTDLREAHRFLFVMTLTI